MAHKQALPTSICSSHARIPRTSLDLENVERRPESPHSDARSRIGISGVWGGQRVRRAAKKRGVREIISPVNFTKSNDYSLSLSSLASRWYLGEMSVATAASVLKANNMSNSFVVYQCPDLDHKFVVTARYGTVWLCMADRQWYGMVD